ncbi:hypothetical protein DEO72_LG2g3213 [Vigna unguiculata]|uniref:Uncharacterized protein n=1 Tax=Vigna unguiculata TaxID=3917 RepID=A0A4D6L2X9_VIGUN|nr:hypothetical protein DEO72_LG2g3213 [Vigna unguiculata]
MVSFSKQSFVHHSHAMCSPSARRSLTFRSRSLVVRSPSARRPRAVHTVRMPPASCLLILRTSSASCSRVLRTVRMPFASCLLVLRAPSASCPHVLCAPRAVHPPYVALFHNQIKKGSK